MHAWILLFSLLSYRLKLRGMVGTDVWQPCSVLETKVCPVLSVSHPAKRKCLTTDTDQLVTDTFYNQIQIYFLLSIIPWAALCYCSSSKHPLYYCLGDEAAARLFTSLSSRGIIQINRRFHIS